MVRPQLRGGGDDHRALVAAADGFLGGVPDGPRLADADRAGEDQVLADAAGEEPRPRLEARVKFAGRGELGGTVLEEVRGEAGARSASQIAAASWLISSGVISRGPFAVALIVSGSLAPPRE